MITGRDLNVIGPPTQQSRRPRIDRPPSETPPGSDALPDGAPASGSASATAPAPPSPGAAPVSISATLTLSGWCTAPVLDALRGQAEALLAAGVGALVVDLSAVTAPDPRLLRALSDLGPDIERHRATLTLIGAIDALAAMIDTATLAHASLIYRSLRQPPPDPVAQLIDPAPVDPGPMTSATRAR
jgi:hypothetical protein